MRHSNKNKKFGREKNQRKALMRTLAVSLLRHGRIRTTTAKAKALRPFVERLISKAKTRGQSSLRLVAGRLGQREATALLVSKIVPRYEQRSGGYTRVVRILNRRSDGAPMAFIELV